MDNPTMYGVWVSDNAQLLVTEMVCLYFEKQCDGAVRVVLRVEGLCEDSSLFTPERAVRVPFPQDFSVSFPNEQEVVVGGNTLRRVEEIEMCNPYDMPTLDSPDQVGERLDEWRLGTVAGYDPVKQNVVVEVSTPKCMMIYLMGTGFHYFRCARIKNTDEGTFFYQNIIFQNNMKGHCICYFSPCNEREVMNEPELVMARFRPDATDYDFTKGVYWHITSTSPDDITLHDVRGKDYYVYRKTIENNIWYEWIKYPGRGI